MQCYTKNSSRFSQQCISPALSVLNLVFLFNQYLFPLTVGMLAINIPDEDRSLDILELIERNNILE